MGNESSKGDVDVDALWKEESKLSTKERRKRYKCGDKFVPLEKIPEWESIAEKTLEEAIPQAIEDARDDERYRRKIEKRDKKKEKKKELKAQKEEKEEEMFSKLKLRQEEKEKEEREEEKRQREERFVSLRKVEYNEEINKKVALIRGDITTLEIDAIVNAANRSLLGGGGIDGAIHNAAGKKLFQECNTLGGAETGETKVTRGYNLPAKYVLHTVGPVGRHEEALLKAYSTCLKQVEKHKIKSVALCGISSGIYGYPLYAASHVALNTVRKWLEVKENRKKVDLIIFCTYLPKELTCYQKLMPLYFPPKGKNTEEVEKLLKASYDSYDPNDTLLEKEQKAEKEKKQKMKEELAKREAEKREKTSKQARRSEDRKEDNVNKDKDKEKNEDEEKVEDKNEEKTENKEENKDEDNGENKDENKGENKDENKGENKDEDENQDKIIVE